MRKFKETSASDFDDCCGATYGLLIWISRPTCKDEADSNMGPKKNFCGRKGKFGLNFQGVCDVKGRCLDVAIGHPGSTSDYIAFVTSSLHSKLENQVF